MRADGFEFNHIGWKYYNKIKKKAMEQEFSMSGLLVSLSIAFFVVISSAFILSLINSSLNEARSIINISEKNLYILETANAEKAQKYLNTDFVRNERLSNVNYDYLS